MCIRDRHHVVDKENQLALGVQIRRNVLQLKNVLFAVIQLMQRGELVGTKCSQQGECALVQRDANMSASALWKNIELDYRTVPPIDLVLTVDHFDRYNALFRFLFAAKRTQIELQQLWPWQMQTRKMALKKQTRLAKVFLLRQRMQFFVNNIQFYFLADGVEPLHRLLLKKIGTRSFFCCCF